MEAIAAIPQGGAPDSGGASTLFDDFYAVTRAWVKWSADLSKFQMSPAAAIRLTYGSGAYNQLPYVYPTWALSGGYRTWSAFNAVSQSSGARIFAFHNSAWANIASGSPPAGEWYECGLAYKSGNPADYDRLDPDVRIFGVERFFTSDRAGVLRWTTSPAQLGRRVGGPRLVSVHHAGQRNNGNLLRRCFQSR